MLARREKQVIPEQPALLVLQELLEPVRLVLLDRQAPQALVKLVRLVTREQLVRRALLVTPGPVRLALLAQQETRALGKWALLVTQER